ncbi:branched-chain amino acid transport system II carrier protein [Sedimentibacter sp. zth1]|uniref:branched-chain amino acid transport system II carrier protein n=1 Tax=Sedimentibacter sp. zth1 TaxID=2816908 RepID=UPI001A9245DB|nr:branched-chain amino acid transport system II carrier protein [Sedimentibacter sp. zth1]QSX06769.1 branched-chain amino acid transport system II carrier protein [Sedimentibacter sp. zth1]
MKKNKDALVIGLALFALFFGAGNLIFPPFLGMAAGKQWVLGFIIYFIFDIGLALVGIYAITKNGGKLEGVTDKIGKTPALIISIILVICIGPAFVIPRTAATTFEMLVNTNVVSQSSNIIFSIIYFGIVVLLSIRPSKVIDIVGKLLTPILFAGLTFLIVYGIAKPLGPISDVAMIDSVVKEGVTTGYQTMDVFGGLVLAGIIIESVVAKGYKDKRSQSKVTVRACIVASVLLLFVYGGLTFLGATASTKFGLDIDRTSLLVAVTNGLLGRLGSLALSLIVSVACLTTAIGLTSSCANYFEELTKGKVTYKVLVILSTVISFLIANLGLNKIIAIAAPILNLTYPIVLTMIALSLSSKHKNKFVNYGAVFGAFLISFLSVINSFGIDIEFIKSLPLFEYELHWIIPAILGGVIGGMFGEFLKAGRSDDSKKKVKAN